MFIFVDWNDCSIRIAINSQRIYSSGITRWYGWGGGAGMEYPSTSGEHKAVSGAQKSMNWGFSYGAWGSLGDGATVWDMSWGARVSLELPTLILL